MSKVNDFINRALGRPREIYDELEDYMQGEGFVYFVREGLLGPIKIGCTESLKRRLTDLKNMHATPLILMGVVRGGAVLEGVLHARYAEERLHGEWFRASDRLLAGIQALLRCPKAEVSQAQLVETFVKRRK